MNVRQTAIELLEKLEVPHTSKISKERAVIKLKRNLDVNNLPAVLTDDEKELLGQLGIEVQEVEPKKEEKAPPEKKKEQSEKSGQYCSWIECATEAILECGNTNDAGKRTVEIFRSKNPNSNIKGNYGPLYVTYASKVLIMVGIISLNGKEIIHLSHG